MANIAILKSEIDSDPLGRGYSGMDDTAVAVDVNTAYRTKKEPISSAELLAWSASDARLQNIKNAAENGATDDLKSLAQAAYLIVTRDGTTLDLNLADRVAMLDSLVAAGVLTAADRSSLAALATVSISRAEELALGLVRAGTVQQARSM
jgi:hypothetical protein